MDIEKIPVHYDEEIYRSIIENSMDAFFLAILDGTVQVSNKAASEIFGYSPEEFKYIKREDLIDHNDPNLFALMQLREKNGQARGEVIGIRKNGERFPIEISSSIIHKGIKGKERTSTLIRDITEQKEAQLALKESENELRTVLQTEPECVNLLSRTGELIEINPAGLAMMEADSFEQVKGKPVSKLVTFQHLTAFNKLIEDIFNDASGILEYEIIGLKGTPRWVETHAVPLKNAAGEIISLLGITRDITQRKEAEKKLAEANRLRENLISTIDGIVWASDADSTFFEFVSDKAERLLGYPITQWLTEANFWYNHMHPDDKEWVVKFSDAEAKHKGSFELEYRMLAANGSIVWVRDIVRVIAENNEPTKLRGIMIDITEKVQLANTLSEERQRKQQAITDAVITGQEQEKSELGEELHDNINQILATTKLYIECALSDDTLRKDLLNESKTLVDAAMNEIRKLSKSLLPPSLGEVGLLGALNDMLESIEEVHPLHIERDWENFTEELLTEKLKLTIFRIVQEHLNNIFKYAEATHVLIRIKEQDNVLCLQIKDDGVGFDTSKKRKGVGLKNITSRAEVNNGKVQIISQPGAGCEIKVDFPLLKL